MRRGGRTPPPAYGGHLPFQGRLCVEVCPKGSLCGSMRGAAAKPPQVTVSCPLGVTKGLCDRPLETFARSPLPTIWYPTLAGRGGSVSRRDHNQAAGSRAHLSGGTKPEETSQPKRQPLFGREGSGGRGASLREAASPPRISPPHVFRGGSAREGTFLQKRPLPRILPAVPLKFTLWHLWFWGNYGIMKGCKSVLLRQRSKSIESV